MQALWAAGSVMLTQGSSACAGAGGMQRGASAMAAAADRPIIALFMSSPFLTHLMAALLSPPIQCRTFTRNRLSGAQAARSAFARGEGRSLAGIADELNALPGI
jgi:hypothetical protein